MASDLIREEKTQVELEEAQTETAPEPVAEDTADAPGEVPIDIEVLDPSSVEVETFDDSVTATESDTGTDTVAETETDADTVAETETDADTVAETETDADTVAETETDTDTVTETDTDTVAETETDTDTVTETDAGVPIEDGTTSVALDAEVLTAAAGLTLSGTENTVDPASDEFAVGFDITEESDFTFSEADGFAPVGGTIEHTGTVTFDSAAGDITVGDFSIGFDESRASDTTSGFFVANTVEGVLPDGAVLFDVGIPDGVEADADSLDIGTADLLVANEFAGVLQETELASDDLTGADVGDAAIAGVSEPVAEEPAEPVVDEPAEPVVDEPVAEEPAEPVVDEPVVDEPVADKPVAEEPAEPAEPVVDEPVAEEPAEPVVDEPVVDEPVAEEPAEPVVDEPVVDEPVAEEPAEPVVDEPVAEEPAEPVVDEPVAGEPAEPTDSGLIEINVLDNGHLDLDFLEDLGIFAESEIEPEPEVEPVPEVEAEVEPEADSAAEVTIQDGTTSVALDSELLTDAAGLTLSGSENTVDPVSEDFAVGFDITEESDFSLSGVDDLAPVGGAIEHTGTVTFDSAAGDITVGDFSIGFDESRASDTTSGFFVANTVEGVLPDGAVLFDVGVPQSLDIADDGLSLGGADLLVSNEFADVLQETELASADLTGADVGDANLDALFG